jgi:thiamine kinase-like enzyme
MRRGLLEPENILEQKIRIREVSSRNLNYQVSSSLHSYMIKQGISPETRIAIKREADFYKYIDKKGDKRLASLFPDFYYFDPKYYILIIEMISEAQNARFYYSRSKNFSARLASTMGSILGILHSNTEEESRKTLDQFTSSRDWKAPFFHLNALKHLSGASISVMKILQEYPEFSKVFKDIDKNWREEAIIHNDIRFDNFLFYKEKNSNSNSKLKVKLIDLELACLGDPRWDVASIFGEFLSQWVLSMPIVPDIHPHEYMKMAVYRIQAMKPAIRSFWHRYSLIRQFEISISNQFLLSSTSYISMKLINSAFEVADSSSKISNNVICLLQMASNIFNRPTEAIRSLLGITLT